MMGISKWNQLVVRNQKTTTPLKEINLQEANKLANEQ